MINFSEEALIQELCNNFLNSLNIVSSRMIFDLFEMKSFPEDFDKNEYLDALVTKWKDSTQKVLQQKINNFYEFQSDKAGENILTSILYGQINIEDLQKICNDAYKEACNKVDDIVKALKEE